MAAQGFGKYRKKLELPGLPEASAQSGTAPLRLHSVGSSEGHSGSTREVNTAESTSHWEPVITEAVRFLKGRSGCGDGIAVRQERKQKRRPGGKDLGGSGCLDCGGGCGRGKK